MIKKVEDWNIHELQAHAKGRIEGTIIGFFLAVALFDVGVGIWALFLR